MNSSEIAVLSDTIIKKFKEVEKLLFDNFTLRQGEVWVKHLKSHIRLCNIAINDADLSVGTLNKLQTNIGHLKRFLILIKNGHVGQGLSPKRSSRVKWEDIISIFEDRVRTGVIINLVHKDITQFLIDAFYLFKIRISNNLKKFHMLKVNTTFCGEFIKKNIENDDIIELKYFNTRNESIDVGTNLNIWFEENVIDKILNKISEFEEKLSGWALQKIVSLEVNVNKLEQGNGASSFVELPGEIKTKRACINVENDDNACFYWSIVSALFPVEQNSRRISSYPHYKQVLKTEGLDLPMTLKDISKFEKLNDISVNVYVLELNEIKGKKIYFTVPVRLTNKKLSSHVNLLLIQDKYFPKINDYDAVPIDDFNIDIQYHYCWIKNLSRLLSNQLSKSNHKKFICDRCLNYFSSDFKLNEHTVYCVDQNKTKVSFPKDLFVKFKNFVHKEKIPFIIYADFESILEPFVDKPNLKTSKYQFHRAFSAGYYLKCSYDDNLSYFNSYAGEDCMDWFAKQISHIAQFVQSKFKNIVPMIETVSTLDAKMCHICEQPFNTNDIIVRDHNHFSGKFRNFAHQSCNLNYRKKFIVPIVFHNLTGYDSHFIIKHLAKLSKISLLPINKEKYISFTYQDINTEIKFRFIDSFRFMGASLDTLSSSLQKEDFKNLKKEFNNLDEETFDLLSRKGVFCYDYINCWDKLKETELPPIDKFYNKLNDSHISKEQYQHAKTVWDKFNIKNLLEYSLLYLKTDIMLLTDVFESFREIGHMTHDLDPAWYYTVPGYTWDCMLKFTKCELELLDDIDIIMFIEKALRGGISQCSNRYSQANNKYMKNYDPSQPSQYILYLDINNLYGYGMIQPLPYGGFKWADTNIDVTVIPDDSLVGYILEVDLTYPKSLHDKHKDLPFCPEHRIPQDCKLPKLLTTLYNKEKYILHYRSLKQVLEHGLILTKVHRVLEFKQSTWLKPYIELNTKLRTLAITDFQKEHYKIKINAIYGKTMENIRKHRLIRLINSYEGRYGAKNMISSPNFHNRTIFDDDLMAIEMRKLELKFNKPLYIGMAILDISKVCLYDFHYNYMLKKFSQDQCKLLYTDTDSYIYEIKCNDVYKDVIKKDLHKFDTSNYPSENIYEIPLVNKKVPGLLKDEASGKIVTNFVGLRSKMYSFLVDRKKDSCIKKSKGVRSNIVKNRITFTDYVNCLKENKIMSDNQCTIRSYAHNVYSIKQSKIVLSPHDNKRKLLPNSFDTLPWGHYSIIE